MKILYINVKGLGAIPKKITLKWLITTMSPSVISIQQTMTEGYQAEEMGKECKKDWGMTSNYANGHS